MVLGRQYIIIGAVALAACAPDAHRVDTVVVVQSGGPAAPADPIAVIRSRYDRIERELSRYARREVELTDMSTEGGLLEVYQSGDEVRKLRATFLGETGRAREQFYFWNGKLIFVFRETEHYDRPLSGRVDRREENRFYFVRDSLARWVDPTGREVPVGSPEAGTAVKEIEETLRELRRQMTGPRE